MRSNREAWDTGLSPSFVARARQQDLIEVRPAENAVSDFDYVGLEWALRWPSEEVWKARRV